MLVSTYAGVHGGAILRKQFGAARIPAFVYSLRSHRLYGNLKGNGILQADRVRLSFHCASSMQKAAYALLVWPICDVVSERIEAL